MFRYIYVTNRNIINGYILLGFHYKMNRSNLYCPYISIQYITFDIYECFLNKMSHS